MTCRLQNDDHSIKDTGLSHRDIVPGSHLQLALSSLGFKEVIKAGRQVADQKFDEAVTVRCRPAA